jgi:thioredoxin-related protein
MRILLTALLFSVFLSNAHAQTIFNDYSWKELLKKAETEQKLIFIDAYTDWCGWCKVMDKNTFSDSSVGQLMNNRFVNTKLEMEKSKLGSQLSMKYGINVFPSFLILNSKGILVFRIEGFRNAKDFISELNNSLEAKNHIINPGYSEGFKVKYPSFYKNLFNYGSKPKFPDSATVINYLNKNAFDKEAVWQVAKRFSFYISTEYAIKINEQKNKIIAQFGELEYNQFVGNIADNMMYKAAKISSLANAEDAMAFGRKYANYSQSQINESWLYFYKEVQNFEKVVEYFELIKADTGTISAEYINGLAWDIYLKCDDQSIIAKAINWINEIPASEMEWNIWDTQASLYYKSNQPENARFAAQKAIEMAKLKGENAKDTEALLDKIKEKK